jgi:hypothetical protein
VTARVRGEGEKNGILGAWRKNTKTLRVRTTICGHIKAMDK